MKWWDSLLCFLLDFSLTYPTRYHKFLYILSIQARKIDKIRKNKERNVWVQEITISLGGISQVLIEMNLKCESARTSHDMIRKNELGRKFYVKLSDGSNSCNSTEQIQVRFSCYCWVIYMKNYVTHYHFVSSNLCKYPRLNPFIHFLSFSLSILPHICFFHLQIAFNSSSIKISYNIFSTLHFTHNSSLTLQ